MAYQRNKYFIFSKLYQSMSFSSIKTIWWENDPFDVCSVRISAKTLSDLDKLETESIEVSLKMIEAMPKFLLIELDELSINPEELIKVKQFILKLQKMLSDDFPDDQYVFVGV